MHHQFGLSSGKVYFSVGSGIGNWALGIEDWVWGIQAAAVAFLIDGLDN